MGKHHTVISKLSVYSDLFILTLFKLRSLRSGCVHFGNFSKMKVDTPHTFLNYGKMTNDAENLH